MATTFKSQFVRHLASNPNGKRNALLQKGFTLVELMVVIVIVGILSAVALPSFLSQTSKAKGTEAKAQISTIMKTASSDFQEGGIDGLKAKIAAGDCLQLGGPQPSSATNPVKFNYGCVVVGDALTVTATGSALDTNIKDKTLVMTLALPNGTIELVSSATDKIFGGSK
jgi:type IV pilus assembly protein PilA